MAESLIEQSYLYLNVNSNASHTEGFDVVPSRVAQIMKKSVTQCLHCTNDSWHLSFYSCTQMKRLLGFPAERELHLTKDAEKAEGWRNNCECMVEVPLIMAL